MSDVAAPSTLIEPAPHPEPDAARASVLLATALAADREGRADDAMRGLEDAAIAAAAERDAETEADALRHLAIAAHRRRDGARARTVGRRSHEVAHDAGLSLRAAQALNTLAAIELGDGEVEIARTLLRHALAAGGADDALSGRIHQNLGIIANIRGDFDEALAHYRLALDAFSAVRDERGCAMVFNSLGMLHADRKRWDEADVEYRRSVSITNAIGDVYLHGLALLNQTEVHIARGRHDDAWLNAEQALAIFDRLGVARYKAYAYRVFGVVYRARGRTQLAEARLVAAIDLAASDGGVLEQAEASRELALLYREQNRNQDALRLLNASHQLFNRLDARIDMVDVASRVDVLEGTFLAIVRDWGQSIESADSYTHGHCERVAQYAVAVAEVMGLDANQLTTIRLGAYLHDVGKVKVPHEILNKPGRLTDEEFEIIKRHPMDGVELLEGIEFPWDIKPMIRSHHEKHDGTGYPERLKGDEIPVHAQIICVADVYDALTTTRSYRGAMSTERALEIMVESRHWWRTEIFDAFMVAIRKIELTANS